MKVLSFNLLGSNKILKADNAPDVAVDARVSSRVGKLNKLLLGEGVDIAGFQEAKVTDDNWHIWLTRKLDPIYGLIGNHTAGTKEGGFVAYRRDKYTPLQCGTFWLYEGEPHIPRKNRYSSWDRMCVWTLFLDNTTKEHFIFADTHLDTADEARPRQARVLTVRIAEVRDRVRNMYGISKCPVITVGDMNTIRDTEPYNILTSVFRDSMLISAGDTVSREYSTRPGFRVCESEADFVKDGCCIDYIFVTDDVRVNHYGMIPTSTNLCPYGEFISDHNAIFAELEF